MNLADMEPSVLEMQTMQAVQDCMAWAEVAIDVIPLVYVRMGILGTDNFRILAAATEADIAATFVDWNIDGNPIILGLKARIRLAHGAALKCGTVLTTQAEQARHVEPGGLLGELGVKRLTYHERRIRGQV